MTEVANQTIEERLIGLRFTQREIYGIGNVTEVEGKLNITFYTEPTSKIWLSALSKEFTEVAPIKFKGKKNIFALRLDIGICETFADEAEKQELHAKLDRVLAEVKEALQSQKRSLP